MGGTLVAVGYRGQALGDFQVLPYIVSSLGGFCTAERAAEIRTFFAAHPVPAAARGLAQALERIDGCVALDQRQSAGPSRPGSRRGRTT